MVCRGGKPPGEMAQGWIATCWLLWKTSTIRSVARICTSWPTRRVRNAVIMPFEGDVVIDAHPGILPPGKFIRALGQGQQGRLVQLFEQLLARLSQVLHFFRIEGL